MLKQRVITGVILAVVVATAVFALPIGWFAGFLSLVLMAALWEWSDLAGIQPLAARLGYCALGLVLMLLLGWGSAVWSDLPRQLVVGEVLVLAAIWWVLALAIVATFPGTSGVWAAKWRRGLMGLLTLLPTWLAFVFLRGHERGDWLLIFVLALVSAADTGAYFSGTRFGRHKLAPEVSPGKTWEGFAGGLIASLLLALIVWLAVWQARFGLFEFLAVTAATALVSVLGDLLESMLKRQRGIKDSGNLLPGHGGVMDRLDSLSAAAPIFALGLLLIHAY